MQLFDDLEDFGEFDDFVSGDVRDPYTELARLRREEPVQRIEIPGFPAKKASPSSWCIAMKTPSRCCGTTRPSRPRSSSRHSATSSASTSCSAWTSRSTAGTGRWCQRRSRRRRWPAGRTSWWAKVGNALIDRFADRGSADLVKEFNFPYPTLIIAGLLGLPQEDFAQFQRWSISLLSLHRQPRARPRGVAGAGGLLRADPGGAAGGPARRSDQRAGRGRDRRGEAVGRGDLLVPAAAAPRRCRDDLPVAGQPVVRLVVQP